MIRSAGSSGAPAAPDVFGRALASILLLAAAGCAPNLVTMPAGAGAPAPDAPATWAAARADCEAVRLFSAALHISGRVARSRIRGGGSVDAAFTADNRLRLEAVGPFNRRVFVVGGTADAATIVFYADDGAHVLTAPAADILEAVAGLRWTPREMLDVVDGCLVADGSFAGARRFDGTLAVDTPDGTALLRETDGRWRIIGGQRGDIVVTYDRFGNGRPGWVHLESTPARVPAVSLSMDLTLFGINLDVPASAFHVEPPPGAAPMTLADLRASGPLGGGS